jgi:tRNA(Arg) A34 adenosine deaminase TadA
MDVKVTSAMSIHRDDPRVDADADVVPSPPGGLADAAAMSNHELFTAVIASIRRDGTGAIKNRRKGGGDKRKKKKKNGGDDDRGGGGDGGGDDGDDGGGGGDDDRWRHVAISVASSAARGEEGCRTAGEWAGRFRSLLLEEPPPNDGTADDGTAVAVPPSTTDFGEALRTLPAGECYRNRLRNALDALDSTATNARDGDGDDARPSRPSVRRAAGLVRCASLLLDGESTGAGADAIAGGGDGGDLGLIARAVSGLARSMPRRGPAGGPILRDILLSVQSPLLRRMDWDALLSGGEGGMIDLASSTSDEEAAEFRRLLDLDFDATARDDCAQRAGEKRKREDPEKGGGSGVEDATTGVGGCTVSRLLEAAHHARKGAVRARHGAVIYVEEEDEEDEEEEDGGGGRGTRKTRKTTVIGRGWNHDYFLDPSTLGRKNKIVLHSEVHAVADAICNYGEDECFERLFPRATIMIVELASDYAYDTCHPCPKCDPLLRAVGIPTVLHTTPHGRIVELDLRPANAALLSNENVYIPLIAACRERNITCGRLQQKCELVIAKEEDRRQVPARPGRS